MNQIEVLKRLKKVPNMEESIGNLNEDLTILNGDLSILKDDKVSYKDLRIFKPTFGFNALGTACNDCKTVEEQKIMIDDMKYIGITEVPYCVYVNNNSDGTFVLRDDLDFINQSIEHCKNNGINIPMVHVYVSQTMAIQSNFNSEYKKIITQILNIFSQVNYEYFVVWNESTQNIITSTVTNTVLECMDIVKTLNKKVGICIQGIEPINYVSSSIFEKSDFIGFNCYPRISSKGERTTLDDGIIAWGESGTKEIFNYAKSKYPNADIILTESGIINSWRALNQPSYWSFDWETYDSTNKVLEIYYGGLLENLKDAKIKYAFGWFPHDFLKGKEQMKTLISKYVKGGK